MNYKQKAKELARRLTFSKELHPTTDITVFARETDDYNSFNVVTPNLGVYLCKDGKITIEKELTGFMNDSSIKEFDELENVLSEITDFFYVKITSGGYGENGYSEVFETVVLIKEW